MTKLPPDASGHHGEKSISRTELAQLLTTALGQCPCGLNRLPNELLDDISVHLVFGDLLRLLRVSKIVYHALEHSWRDFVYRSLEIRVKCSVKLSKQGATYQVTEPLPKVDLLVRTLVRKPELAQHIKHLDIGYDVLTHRLCSLYRRFLPLDAGDMSRAEDVLVEHGSSVNSEWMRKLRQCRTDVLLGIILVKSIHIETLRLSPELLKQDSFVTHMLGQCMPRMWNLREVDLLPPRKYPGYLYDESTIDSFLPFLQAPTMHKLALVLPHVRPGYEYDTTDMRLKWPITGMPIMAEALTHLELRSTRLPEICLAQILRRCINLETLVYEYECRREFRPGLNADHLAVAISHVSQSIKQLSIFVSWNPCNETHEHPWIGGSSVEGSLDTVLATCSEMTSLTISPVILLGWQPFDAVPMHQALPPNLSHLHLVNNLSNSRDFQWKAQVLCEKVRDYLTSDAAIYLESLIMDRLSLYTAEAESAVAQCEKVCKERGMNSRIFDRIVRT